MKRILAVIILFLFAGVVTAADHHSYFIIRVFHFQNSTQEKLLDNYLQQSIMPALHKKGIKQIGVFKAIANDTATDKSLYLFFPISSLNQTELLHQIEGDSATLQHSDAYNVAYNAPAYSRTETILLKAFSDMPFARAPKLNNDRNDRVYELRSYESASERLYRNKVRMFNEGGEIKLFERLQFNAVFYGEVLTGSRMPNLMYMTSFENKAARDEHWKTFVADDEWKKLSAMPQYQNNVSHIDIVFLKPTVYSDF